MNCSFCGKQNPTGEAFCSNCGASLQGTNAPQSSTATPSQAHQAKQNQNANAAVGLKDCPNCGSVSSSRAVICQQCGHVFGHTTRQNANQPTGQNSMKAVHLSFSPKDWSQPYFCVCCGTKIEENLYCPNKDCNDKHAGFVNQSEYTQAHAQHVSEAHQPVETSSTNLTPLSVELIIDKVSIEEGQTLELNWRVSGGKITKRELTLPNGKISVGKTGPLIDIPPAGSVEYVLVVEDDQGRTDQDRKIVLVTPKQSSQLTNSQPLVQYRFCPNCGNNTQGARRFCMKCGQDLTQ